MRSAISVLAFTCLTVLLLFMGASPALRVSTEEADIMEETAAMQDGVYVIELESNPTTGYCWVIKSSEGLNVEKEFIPSDKDGMICGAPGKEIFRVTSDAPGTYELVLSYERTFEKDSSVRTETYEITF